MADEPSPSELLLHIQTVEELEQKLGGFTKEQLVRLCFSRLCFRPKKADAALLRR